MQFSSVSYNVYVTFGVSAANIKSTWPFTELVLCLIFVWHKVTDCPIQGVVESNHFNSMYSIRGLWPLVQFTVIAC